MYTSSNYLKYHTKNPLALFFINRFLNRILGTVSFLNVQRILDVGCGEGFVISYLRHHGIRTFFKGVDKNETALRMAKNLNPEVPFSCMDVYALHFGDKSFDVVMALELLEHLDEPIRALKELCRVSRQYVILSVPNEPLFSFGNLARGRHIHRLGRDPEHVQFWRRREFIKMVIPFFRQVQDLSLFPWAICMGIEPK